VQPTGSICLPNARLAMEQDNVTLAFALDKVCAPCGLAREFLAKALEKVACRCGYDQRLNQIWSELGQREAFNS
jgi:hypothetical protein